MTRQEIITTAEQILARQVDPLEGCRSIVQSQSRLSEEDRLDPDLLTLVGIDSETDHFPTGDVRQRWNPESLRLLDAQRLEYLARNESLLREACSALIKKFG